MPDLIDQIIARALSKEPGTVAQKFLAEKERKLERMLDKRATLLAQPDLLERRVAAHAGAFSLSTRRPRTRRFQSKIDALEEQAKGTPQAGFASELLETYTAALNDPTYLGVSNRQLLGAVSRDLMLKPDEEGKSRLEKAYRYKWRADTSVGNLFGIFGEDKDTRALPGYEKYLEIQKAQPVDEWHTGPLEAAGIGAGFTAALMGASKLVGRGLMVTPAPGARIVGGALMAIPEFMAFDAVHNVIAKTEWGRAREGTWKKIGADLLAGGVVLGGGYKIATAAIKKAAEKAILSKTVTDVLMKHPTAKRAIEAGEAQRVARAEQARANESIIRNIGREDVLTEVANLSAVLERAKLAKVGEAAEARMAREMAKPSVAHPGAAPMAAGIAKAVIPKAEAKPGELIKFLLAPGRQPRYAGEKFDVGKAYAGLSEKGAERVLSKAGKEGGVKTAVAEEVRIAELEAQVAEREKDYIKALERKEAELEETYIARLEERELTLENELVTKQAGKTRVKQRAQKKVQKDIAEVSGKAARITAASINEHIASSIKEGIAPGLGLTIEGDISAAEWLMKKEGITGKSLGEKIVKWAEKKGYNLDVYTSEEDLVSSVAAEGSLLPGRPMPKEDIKASLRAAREGAKPKVKKVPPEATGLTEESKAAIEAVEEETRQTVSIAEEAGLEELLYGGGAGEEETFIEGVKKGGKDLTDLINDSKKLFVGIGVFGSVALASLFEPDSAEASVFSSARVVVPKVLARTAEKVKAKAAMVKLADEWFKARHIHIPAPEGAKEKFTFQEAVRTAPMAIEEYGSLIKNIKAESTPFSLVKVLSPYTSGEILYKVNPVPEIGNVQSCIGNNAGDALRVVGNIFKDVPGLIQKGAAKDIMDTMSPIAKRYSGDVAALRAVEFDLNKTKRSFDKLYKALSKEKGEQHIPAIEKIEERMAKLVVAKEELTPALIDYLRDWETAVQSLAKKYPVTRIALAAEDTAQYTKYPWLKKMMTPAEEEAVIWLKGLHETYAVRMAETGHKVIEGPYVHHAWHPDWLEEAATRRLEEFGLDSKGVPFSKFYHRAKYSRMMMPDINHTMQKYLMDAERRIQWSQFWGKGTKNSWYAHKRWVDIHGSRDQQIFWKKIADGSIPPAPTRANIISNIYSSFEVLRLLAFSPSVALKHYFKNIGTASAMGAGNFASHLPEAAITAIRGARNSPEMKAIYKRFGIQSPKGKKRLFDEVAGSFIAQIHRMNMIADLDFEAVIPHRVGFWQAVTKKMQTFNRWGSIPVRAIESVDRHHTVVAAWEAAAKKGMTAQQAIYGIYSNILKLNFLSGAANPSWIRNPKIRSMVLFQNTVFKIMERRLMTAWGAGKDCKTAIGLIKHQDIKRTLQEMAEIGRYILGAEKELKQNMIFDALTASKDVFGTPMLQQAMREAILSGAILMGGGIVGMNLMPQVWHVPLLRHGARAPTLAVNPFVNAAFRVAGERAEAEEYGVEKDFIVTQFIKNWLKSTGYLPQTLNKAIRITQDDVPEIYKGSRWQYFFSIPAAGEHY